MTLPIVSTSALVYACIVILGALVLAVEATMRVRRAAAFRSWHRVAVLVALAVLSPSLWVWPACIVEIIVAIEDREGWDGFDGELPSQVVRRVAEMLSIALCIAAAAGTVAAAVGIAGRALGVK